MGWRIHIRRVDRELEVERVRVSELEQEGARVRGELEVERARVSELEQESAKNKREVDEARRQIAGLAASNKELEARKALFYEELAKAEGQLDLIKDLVLDGGLAGPREK
jgi:chromosome segregation ATPase